MPMPGDAPIPVSLIAVPAAAATGRALRLPPHCSPPTAASWLAPELAVDELAQRRHHVALVGALGAHADRRALLGGEHHDTHDALAVHLEVVARDPDLGLE